MYNLTQNKEYTSYLAIDVKVGDILLDGGDYFIVDDNNYTTAFFCINTSNQNAEVCIRGRSLPALEAIELLEQQREHSDI